MKTKLQDAYQENILFMILDVWLCQKGWGNLQKQQMVLPVSCNLLPPLFQLLLSQHPCILWDIVSNLNLHVKKSFHEQISKHRDNQIIKDIYLLMQNKIPQQHGFLFLNV